jgi:hypothetical protein
MTTIQNILSDIQIDAPELESLPPERPIPDGRIWPADLVALLDNPKATKLLVDAPDNAVANLCRNCGGARLMFVFVSVSGPYAQPNGGKVKWLPTPVPGWYTGETHSSPCPRCTGEAWKDYLRANCGLKGDDLSVSLEQFRVTGDFAEKQLAQRAARNMLGMNERPEGFVTFWGQPGRGKSHLLKSLVNGFRGIGVRSRYVNASDLIAEIRDMFGDDRGGIAVEAAIRETRQIPVLAIDELDQIAHTPWVMQTMHRLLDTRYESSGLLTVLAMKNNPDSLPEDMAYLASRISGGVPVEVEGCDVREILGARAQRGLYND